MSKKKLKSLPPGADAGVPRATAAQRRGVKIVRINPQVKAKKGWVA